MQIRLKMFWLARHVSALLTAASLLGGCVVNITLSTPAPSATNAPDGWNSLAPGLERRVLIPKTSNPLAQIVVLRVDPALYSFRAHYSTPLSLSQWRDGLPGVAAFINGNFFDRQGAALGLVVTDGLVYGQSFVGYGGMFQVQNGVPRVRSNIYEPYYGEALEQAVQAFPMLMLDGQVSYTRNDTDVSRRTMVGQDSQGRILLMVTPLVGFTLPEMAQLLAASDLGLVNALNLDGGGSSMMYVAHDGYTLQSFDAVPVILAIYPR